jgi:BirA family biotin operon repressor/biotin-[acetyl-CoA-carboxylase] ligase
MIRKFIELDSTNKYCLENYNELNHMDVVYALIQTSGRGRLGRTWVSEDSITMSIILKDDLNYDAGLVSFVAASVLHNIINKYTKDVSIKWPNDILVNNQKICGILCQSKIEGNDMKCLVVGIGLNSNTTKFEKELSEKATSLYILNNTKYDNDQLVIEIYNEFNKVYEDFIKGGKEYLNICRKHNYLLNKEIEFVYQNNTLAGVVKGIDDECKLIVDTNSEILHLNTGEVLLKKSYFF